MLHEINKCSRENNNLVEWLKLYDDQIKNYQKQIYDLNLKLYFSSSSQSSQQQPQPQLQQSPTFKSLADYFKNQE